MSNLFKSNVTVAAGTALSRVSGLLRVVVFGAVIGRTALADTYKIANETPNIVYELLLGGVLSATLVPLFSAFVETDDEEATNVVITAAVTLMAALTAVAVLAAPLIFRLYTLSPRRERRRRPAPRRRHDAHPDLPASRSCSTACPGSPTRS